MKSCKICDSATYSLGRSKVLGKYWVRYRRCRHCHFVFAEDVTWLDEAYSDAINTSDLGLVGRNIRLSYSLSLLIRSQFNRRGRFVDYGGGYGLLVRIMRDMGFDFYRYDQYCENLFARGFDLDPAKESAKSFEMLIAIEVFEHLLNPVEEIQRMSVFSDNLFFSTELLPDNREVLPGEWSYYGLEHGQHISMFTPRSLRILAERLRLNFVSDGRAVHMLTPRKIPDWLFRLQTTSGLGKLAQPLLRQESFLAKDYHRVTGHDL